MGDLVSSYRTLSSSSSRKEVDSVLGSIIDASPIAFVAETRVELINLLLADVKLLSTNSKSRLASADAPRALLALKTLGRHPAGSGELSKAANLSLLLSLSTAFSKDAPAASSEALRCIANALLLIEEARITWIKKEVGGGQASIDLLEKSSSPEQIFLASRILFLCTASMWPAATFIRSLLEGKHDIVEVIVGKLDYLSRAIVTGAPMAKDAMSDLLKLSFNLLLHYPKLIDSDSNPGSNEPKVMGDAWSPKLNGFLPALLRVFNSLPPTFPSPLAPPLTHVIHTLISIPISDPLRPIWLPSRTPSSRTSSTSTSPSSKTKQLNSRPGSPLNNTREHRSGPMDKAISVLTAGRRSMSRSSSPMSSPTTTQSPQSSIPRDTLLQAYDLLEVSCSHYLPGSIEPDDVSVRDTVKAETENTLDDLLSPLVVLITRLCIADEGCRVRMREWLVPADLDRTESLESRADLLGRCLRLLSSVYHDRLKSAIGEMLYATCNSDASLLCTLVGYGNVAGFLFNKGVMSAPPSTSDSTAQSPDLDGINPITGSVEKKVELPEMTDEEKEREAERLFVLFDRLEKTGAMPASQNPIRKAIAEGKMG